MTENPEQLIAAAAQLCYSSKADVNSLLTSLTEEKVNKFIEKLESLGHESPFEHVSFTFAVEGVSRVLTHELVRARIASYSQRSMRYCAEGEFDYTVPRTIPEEEVPNYKSFMEVCRDYYNELIAMGVPKEDARFVLPHATHTRIIFTMNVRELWNWFGVRCCTRAQWEIRQLAYKVLRICKRVAPLLFSHAGPNCERKGYCPEGSMSCGRYPTMDHLLASYRVLEGYHSQK